VGGMGGVCSSVEQRVGGVGSFFSPEKNEVGSFSYAFPLDIFSVGYYYMLSINKLSSKGIVIENTFFLRKEH
jgi:hypothetical protein